jgi:hypothetical protein
MKPLTFFSYLIVFLIAFILGEVNAFFSIKKDELKTPIILSKVVQPRYCESLAKGDTIYVKWVGSIDAYSVTNNRTDLSLVECIMIGEYKIYKIWKYSDIIQP